MQFSDPRWLWLLAVLPLLALFEWRASRRGDRALVRLVGEREDSVLLALRRPGARRVGALLRLFAVAGMAIGAAGPEWGREVVRRTAYGSDVVLVLDTSASMDVRDVAPSRLEEAKREAAAVVEHMEGSRLGLVVFAGDAVRLCPLTLDRSATRLLLESVNSAAVSEPGSDLGRGLRAAGAALPPGRHTEQVIIVWTDGEDLEQAAGTAAEEVAARGIRVFAVGVGTRGGDVVPVLDEQGRAVDVKRDEQGGPVRSRLDEALLRSVARRTGGAYFAATRPGGELPRLLGALGHISRGARGERLSERPVPRFPWLASLAALALAGEWLRPRRRAAALALGAVLLLARDAGAQSAWARGNQAYRAGAFAAAESLYRERLRGGAVPGVLVNQGAALAHEGQGADAERAWRQAARSRSAAGEHALYNLGTWLGDQGRVDDGLAELREALRRDPTDRDARHNYEVLMQRRERETPRRPQRDQQRPQRGSPQGGGQNPSQPQPSPSPPPPSAGSGPPPQAGPGAPAGMTREQADWLQTVTDQAEREQRRRRQARVVRERRGRDW
jgi:Ca-activated chloride channel family protein